MTSSVSGQDEPIPVLWLASWAGKMVLSCPLGIICCFPQKNSVLFQYNKSFIDQACLVKMARYWPCCFFVCLWTETESRSHQQAKKKNFANIQPSWPHAWSVTHVFSTINFIVQTYLWVSIHGMVFTIILVLAGLKECLMHLHVTVSFTANTINI